MKEQEWVYLHSYSFAIKFKLLAASTKENTISFMIQFYLITIGSKTFHMVIGHLELWFNSGLAWSNLGMEMLVFSFMLFTLQYDYNICIYIFVDAGSLIISWLSHIKFVSMKWVTLAFQIVKTKFAVGLLSLSSI